MIARAWLLAAALSVALSHAQARAGEQIDLNEASLAQLEELPGIGPKKALAIVALRERRPFSRVSQLLEVRGIGKKTLERLKPLVQIGAGRARPPSQAPVVKGEARAPLPAAGGVAEVGP